MMYRFGDCELDTETYTLRRGGRPVPLRPRVFQVLTYLLEHRQRVVTRQELFEQIWAERFVSDAALESCVKAVRQTIGDSGRGQRMLQTVRGYGYRFVADVAIHSALPLDTQAQTEPAQEYASASSGFLSPPWVGERKLVTILGCALVLRERLHLDTLHRFMRELYDLVHSELHRYGGTIQHVAGDRFLALFGAPVAQEDHARRAVLAALGLHQRLSTRRGALGLSPEEKLVVRMGLHTGLMAVGGIGDDRAISTPVVGDAAVLVAALLDMAEPGTILCSDATAHLVQGAVLLETVRPVPVAGQPTSVMGYNVLGIGPQRSPIIQRGERTLNQFVGRKRELATLHALLGQVESGRGQVVGIVGEPGIGKSRLVYEFCRSLMRRRLTYLTGRCPSYGSHTPYVPVLDLLRHNCGITDTDSPEAIAAKVRRSLQEVGIEPEEGAPYLLYLLGVPTGMDQLTALSPQALKARTLSTLVQMSINGSRQRPLVFEIEDLHWIDPTSEEYLVSLVQQLAGAPLLLLVTYRSGYQPPWMTKSYATQIALQRLTPDDSRRVVRAILGTGRFPASLVQAILARADGNPFFLEELARTVVEHGDHGPTLVVPDTIQAVLAARMDQLPPEEKWLLQTAAVLGKDVTFSLLQAITAWSEERLLRNLTYLQDGEFLYEIGHFSQPAYTFKHALTQEVAYQLLLHDTRQDMHRHIAQVLKTRFSEIVAQQPELLAHHYTEAGLSESAIGYWQRAGQRAMERSAYVEASRLLSKGLTLLATLSPTPERIQQELDIRIALGPALMATAGFGAPEVEQSYAQARALCRQGEDTPRLFSVLLGLWRFYLSRSKVHTARELAEESLMLAQRLSDPALLLGGHWALGQTLLFLGELPLGRTHLEHAMILYTPQQRRHGTDPGVTSLAYEALALWFLGYPDQALHKSREACALARELSDTFSLAQALNWTAIVHHLRREEHAVQELAETVIGLSLEQEFPQRLAVGKMHRGWALAMQGRGAEGIAQIRQGLTEWRTTGAEIARPFFLDLLAEAYQTEQRLEEGLTTLADALALVDNTGESWWAAELYRLKGALLLTLPAPRHAEAEICFHQALAVARGQQAKSWELRAAMSLSRLWQQQSKQDAARQLLAEVYGWFTEGFNTADLREAKVLLEELAS